MDSFQLINQLERNLKTAHMSAKPGFKKGDLSPRSETSNENQKVILVPIPSELYQTIFRIIRRC